VLDESKVLPTPATIDDAPRELTAPELTRALLDEGTPRTDA